MTLESQAENIFTTPSFAHKKQKLDTSGDDKMNYENLAHCNYACSIVGGGGMQWRSVIGKLHAASHAN